MVTRVNVAPHMLQWARRRSRRPAEDFSKFSKLDEWVAGDIHPTVRQLEEYAKTTHTPFGFFFLPEPPTEELPVPDFRTFSDGELEDPSPDLLDTIYACEQRQEWYREFAQSHNFDSVGLVGSLSEEHQNPVEAATSLTDILGFELSRRVDYSNWTEALVGLVEHAEAAGVLVMINGVVGGNTHRKLNPEEFRGFALVDDLAPVIFINGADTKAAQIFTLAHELAHIALGGSAVSRPDLANLDVSNSTERWCNRVAAELLVPLASIVTEYDGAADLTRELDRLARFYKVSTLVVLRRVYDAKLMTKSAYQAAFPEELQRVLDLAAQKGSGGNFYNTQPWRISKTFARALISDTNEGRTLYRDAFRLLGSKKVSAFDELGHRLGVA